MFSRGIERGQWHEMDQQRFQSAKIESFQVLYFLR